METVVEGWGRLLRPVSIRMAVVVLGFCLPAMAALGGDVTSAEADRVQMKASMRATQIGAYTVQEIHAPGGTTVKEYVSPSGKVFAVTWHGPFIPDMQQILGAYFQQYSAALQAQPKHYGRGPLNIQLPGLIVQAAGHMRAYWGRAYVPQILPESIQADEIKYEFGGVCARDYFANGCGMPGVRGRMRWGQQ